MDNLQIRLDIIDNMSQTLQNIQRLSRTSVANMTADQRTYSNAISNSRQAILQLSRDLQTASRQDRKNIQEQIRLQNQLLQVQRQGYQQATQQARQSALATARQNRNLQSFAGGAISSIGGPVGMLASGNPYMIAGQIIGKGVSEAIDFGKEIIKVRGEFETLQNILEVSSGTKIGAVETFSKIKETAKETSFEVKDLTEMFVRLSNRIPGLKFDKSQMIAIADAAASIGKPMEMVTGAMTDVTDVARWKNLGISVSKANGNITFSNGRVTKTYKEAADAGLQFMTELGKSEGVAGISAKAMDSIEGKISNLNDSFNILKDNLGKQFEKEIKGSISGIGKVIQYFTDLTEIPLSETLMDEKTKMETLYQQLLKTNQGSKERKDLLDQLKQIYPEYFKYLDAEKAKIYDITKAHDLAAKAANDRIAQGIKQEQLAPTLKKEAGIREDLARTTQQRDLFNAFQNAQSDAERKSIQRLYENTGGKLKLGSVATGKTKESIAAQRLEYSKAVIHNQQRLDAILKEKDIIDKVLSKETANVRQNAESNFAYQRSEILKKPIKDRTFGEKAFLKEYQNPKHTNESLDKALKSTAPTPKTPNGNAATNLEIEKIKLEEQQLKDKMNINKAVNAELSTSKNINQINLTVQKAIGQEISQQTIQNSKDIDIEKIAQQVIMVFQKQMADITTNKIYQK